jgi:hypothetical protein
VPARWQFATDPAPHEHVGKVDTKFLSSVGERNCYVCPADDDRDVRGGPTQLSCQG